MKEKALKNLRLRETPFKIPQAISYRNIKAVHEYISLLCDFKMTIIRLFILNNLHNLIKQLNAQVQKNGRPNDWQTFRALYALSSDIGLPTLIKYN